MINGTVIGTVKDNVDPDGQHRVLVEYKVDAEQAPASTWVRMASPMAGGSRGMVMLPDKGTEVILVYGTQALHPYLVGCVYNGGEDKAEPYANDDGDNNVRLFWSRAGSMVMFSDEPGNEFVSLGATSGSRMDVTGGPIHQTADAAKKEFRQYSDKDTIWECAATLSIKCKDFKVICDNSLTQSAGKTLVHNAKNQAKYTSTISTFKAATVHINGGAPLPPKKVKATPAHSHPPTGGGGGGASAAPAQVPTSTALAFEPQDSAPQIQVGPDVLGLEAHAPDGRVLGAVVLSANAEPAEWSRSLPAAPEIREVGSWAPHDSDDHAHGPQSQPVADDTGSWAHSLPVRKEPALKAPPLLGPPSDPAALSPSLDG